VDIIFGKQATVIGAAQPMSDFVKGTSGNAYESSVVLISSPAAAFSNVGPYTVHGTNQLLSNSIPGQTIPF